ncbi:MAG: acyl-CoA dehydrogenase family protein [Pseudomonadota bacterium]
MDFSIPDAQQKKLQTAQRFIETNVVPLEARLVSGESWFDLEPALYALRDEVKALGLWAPNLPAEEGGTFESLVFLGLLSEVLGYTPLGHFVFGCQAPDAGNAELLHLQGTQEQKERFLAPLARGDVRSCFAMTEPATAGSNPTLLEARAELVDGEWVINGRKWFTSSADGANFTIAMVVTEPEAQKHQRASMILVPFDTPGLSMIRNIPVMGHAGSGYFSHAEIEFKDCRVPEGNLLGGRGEGFLLAQQRLGPGRIHHAMRWLGICRRAQDELCKYVSGRAINARETLADQQIVQTWIAENAAEIAASRALTLETAWLLDERGFHAAREHVALVKFQSANTLQRVVDRALQAHGSLGMTDDTILAFYYREERAARIYDGPDEVHKMTVAKKILKRYRNTDATSAAAE